MTDAKDEKKEEKKRESGVASITPLSCDLSVLEEKASTLGRKDLKPEEVEVIARLGLLYLLKSRESSGGRYDTEAKNDSISASKYLRQAAKYTDIPAGQMALAVCYRQEFIETENRDKKAFELLLKAVKGRYIWAKPLLAQMYDEKGDNDVAYNLLVEAANSQLAFAQAELSKVLLRGEHVTKNIELAGQFAEEAAKQKLQAVATTLSTLGMNYLWGAKGVKQDISRAIRFLTEASELGDRNAMRVLAQCYYRGRGVPRDRKRSVKLYYEAMCKGDQAARDELSVLTTDFFESSGVYRLVSPSDSLRQVLFKFVLYNLLDFQQIHGDKSLDTQNADELEAINILEELLGPIEKNTEAYWLIILGDLYKKQGMLSEAKKCYLHAATQLWDNEALSRLLNMQDRDGILTDEKKLHELQQEANGLGYEEATRTLMLHYFESLNRIWLQSRDANTSAEEKEKLHQELLTQGITAAQVLRGATTFANPRIYQDVGKFFDQFGLFIDPAIIYHCRVVMPCFFSGGEKVSLDNLASLLRSSTQKCLQLIETDLGLDQNITRAVASLICRFLKDKSRTFPEIDRLKACYGNYCIRIGCFEQGFRSICDLDPKRLSPDMNYWVGVNLFQYSNSSDPLTEAEFHEKGIMHLCKAVQTKSEAAKDEIEAAWKLLRGTIAQEVASGPINEEDRKTIEERYARYFEQAEKKESAMSLDDSEVASLSASSSNVSSGAFSSTTRAFLSGSSSGVDYSSYGAFLSMPSPKKAVTTKQPVSANEQESEDSKAPKVKVTTQMT